ncbi:hypothetical protein MPLB_2040050 [Mesorhizobium sp. ORS 3324]|nr:hypothetical protein MPLB_2040050 [Mesorhizobium sp. ORS 3324]
MKAGTFLDVIGANTLAPILMARALLPNPLLSGEVDLIAPVPLQDVDRVDGTPGPMSRPKNRPKGAMVPNRSDYPEPSIRCWSA